MGIQAIIVISLTFFDMVNHDMEALFQLPVLCGENPSGHRFFQQKIGNTEQLFFHNFFYISMNKMPNIQSCRLFEVA